MGVFAGWINDIPGDGSNLHSLAQGLSVASTELWRTRDELRECARVAPSWEGKARDAFEAELDQVCLSGASLGSGVDSAYRAVDSYAWVVNSAEQRVADLKGAMAEIDRLWVETPREEREANYPLLLARAKTLLNQYHDLLEEVRAEASACGAVLYEALHLEPVNLDDNGMNIGALRVLSLAEMTAIWEGFDSLSYREIKQGRIGDCYYLAGLMAVVSTPEGKAWLKSCVRPRFRPRMDAQPGSVVDGFYVTVYDDPLNPDKSAKREVFVDSIYQRGANGAKPNLVSVFESAYGQIHPGGTRESHSDNGISGGNRAEALQDITSVPAKVVTRYQGIFGWGEGYDTEDQERIRQALFEHRPATAGTGSAPLSYFPDNGWANTTVTIDGAKQIIRIPHGHAYVLEGVSDEGVTLRNPWGYNKLPNNGFTDGSFMMSWEDFGRYYGDVAIGGNYR